MCKKESKASFSTKDHNRKVSGEEFLYFKCPECGLIFLSDIPSDLGRYYGSEYYRVPSLERLKKIARAERFKIDIIKKFMNSGNLLEIGPAFGVFAYQAKEAGFEVDAVEMDKKCCEYLANVVGVNAINSDTPRKAVEKMAKHDVIAMWHVLEHLPDPWECLGALSANLSAGGILVIATPNPGSFQLKAMGDKWPHIDAPRHTSLIPAELLTSFLARSGLERIMLTASDEGGKSWNRFGWQRYLMNRFSGKPAQMIAFLTGWLLSIPMDIFESRGLNGCAYTAVFRRKRAS
ncbi:MAG: class I SAM-dependent methyltransferase [Candidatus Omnitrophica bacterium]|nr:class I SAM-dependent methyltransferase [Candidatus Omnitrophota bacterium]